jgi:F0F1-type ATP synthase assembly protein I
MSHPPEYPGRDRVKRAVARAGSDAYQGAFEAVGAVLLGCGVGFFVDDRWETAPWGVLIGAVIGFAAMVLRLVRLGKELHPDGAAGNDQNTNTNAQLDRRNDEGPGVTPGMSDVLLEDEQNTERPAEREEERRE